MTNVRVEDSIVEKRKSDTEIYEMNKKLMQVTNVRDELSIVEDGKPNTQIQELNKNHGELQDTNVKLVQEKEVQGKELEALHAELAKKNLELEGKITALLKENEEQLNKIETLQEISEIQKMFRLALLIGKL